MPYIVDRGAGQYEVWAEKREGERSFEIVCWDDLPEYIQIAILKLKWGGDVGLDIGFARTMERGYWWVSETGPHSL